jgi:hypothetical protein
LFNRIKVTIMAEQRFRTITQLSLAANISTKTLQKRIRVLLSDPEISKTFGSYPRWTLPLYQQRILIEHIPELMHLRPEL